MDLSEYQKHTQCTDQYLKENTIEDSEIPNGQNIEKAELIPLLGLVGEVGSLLGEYKKLQRDGSIHQNFRDEVKEELGDVLWYVANVAEKFGLDLNDVASANLTKVRARWIRSIEEVRFYDEDLPKSQRLPRKFIYFFKEEVVEGRLMVRMTDALNAGQQTGELLSDNTYGNDGYRFHDIFHLAFATYLGWSPVFRKLLRNNKKLCNRTPHHLDDAEDGGRAQVIEEAIVAAAYVYAEDHAFLEGATTVGSDLLRHIERITRNLEVRNRTGWEWDRALIEGFNIWRQLKDNGGGYVVGKLEKPCLDFKQRLK